MPSALTCTQNIKNHACSLIISCKESTHVVDLTKIITNIYKSLFSDLLREICLKLTHRKRWRTTYAFSSCSSSPTSWLPSWGEATISVVLQPLSVWLSAWLLVWLCRLDYPLIFTTGFRLLLPTQLVSCVRSAGAAESMRRWLISQLTAANELWYVQLLPNPITNCITNLW